MWKRMENCARDCWFFVYHFVWGHLCVLQDVPRLQKSPFTGRNQELDNCEREWFLPLWGIIFLHTRKALLLIFCDLPSKNALAKYLLVNQARGHSSRQYPRTAGGHSWCCSKSMSLYLGITSHDMSWFIGLSHTHSRLFYTVGCNILNITSTKTRPTKFSLVATHRPGGLDLRKRSNHLILWLVVVTMVWAANNTTLADV